MTRWTNFLSRLVTGSPSRRFVRLVSLLLDGVLRYAPAVTSIPNLLYARDAIPYKPAALKFNAVERASS